MMRRDFLVIFNAIVLSSGAAQAAGEACIKVEGDLDRLACYELGRTPRSSAVGIPVQTALEVSQQTSKMTDATNVVLQLKSDEVIDCGWNNGAKIDLLIMCRDGQTSLVFATGCHINSSEYDGNGNIIYRLDADKAKSISATASTDNKALGLWTGQSQYR